MSKRRKRHGGSKANHGTPYGYWLGWNDVRREERWKRASPDPWVIVGTPIINRKRRGAATIAFVGRIDSVSRYVYVAVSRPGDPRFTTSGPMSMRAFYLKWQRACEGCGKAMDVECIDCNAALQAEQMDVYRGMIGPLDPPIMSEGLDPYIRDDDHLSTSAIRCGAVVDPYPQR